MNPIYGCPEFNLWFTSLWLDTGQSLAGMTGRGADSKMQPAGLVFVFEDEAQGDVGGGDRLAVVEAGSVAGGGDAAFGAAGKGGLFGRVDGLYPDVGGPA